jgi:hypothetical protein
MSQHLSLTVSSSSQRPQDLESRMARLATDGPAAVEARLKELDSQWSAGRVAKSILAIAILIGTVLTVTVNWWWVLLPTSAGLLLMQYLFAERSLLVAFLQGLGYRSRGEIEHEKFALRTLRGDFRLLPTLYDIESVDDITRLEGEGGIVVETEERKVAAKDAVKEVLQKTTPNASS